MTPILAGGAAAAWGVLLLFLIPVGGGIPAGVLLARARGLGWPAMLVLYFVSDVILALVFEPVLRLLVSAGRRSPALGRFVAFLRESMRRSAAAYGSAAGPLALILIAFGVDPMTGRAAAAAAGHGFVSGWALAIAGDMLYFVLIAVSTLRLNAALGDGTWTTVIMLAAMTVVPLLLKRWRERGARRCSPPSAAR